MTTPTSATPTEVLVADLKLALSLDTPLARQWRGYAEELAQEAMAYSEPDEEDATEGDYDLAFQAAVVLNLLVVGPDAYNLVSTTRHLRGMLGIAGLDAEDLPEEPK